jgi:hypothetical protein
MLGQKRNFEMHYKLNGDTITFLRIRIDTGDLVLEQFINSPFIVRADETIYDLASGYSYVNIKLIDRKHNIYVIDGKLYRQRRAETDGYGIVKKAYKTNCRLRKKIKQVDVNKCTINILKGKSAYEKYSLIGMNGVIEVDMKK